MCKLVSLLCQLTVSNGSMLYANNGLVVKIVKSYDLEPCSLWVHALYGSIKVTIKFIKKNQETIPVQLWKTGSISTT